MQGGGVLTGGSGGVLSTFSVCEWHGVCVCVCVCAAVCSTVCLVRHD